MVMLLAGSDMWTCSLLRIEGLTETALLRVLMTPWMTVSLRLVLLLCLGLVWKRCLSRCGSVDGVIFGVSLLIINLVLLLVLCFSLIWMCLLVLAHCVSPLSRPLSTRCS